MSELIPFAEIEAKWQKRWEDAKIFKAPIYPRPGKKFYCLDMFPYPSAAGLHVGHPEGYIATDILCRLKIRQDFDVLHPMGWDAFGLPAENFAIQTGRHPRDITRKNIANFKRQVQSLGFSYDWDREINTTDPEYYKCTQWIFLQLFKKGLAYESHAAINWCPSCKTGLANEEVFNSSCERCQTAIERKNLRQWALKITAYAERLEKDLETLDWPHSTVAMQRRWIGKSAGADIFFETERGDAITVFTTRPDTLYGASYLVLSPEHPLALKISSNDKKSEAVRYIEAAKNKLDLERSDLQKDKTGVFTGSYALHPLTGNRIPIWIADYVLASYGSGAVMAVPAHDERDFAFAKKFGLEILPVVLPPSGLLSAALENPYVEDGLAANSPLIEGLPTPEAKKVMIRVLTEKNSGREATRYRLRDWIFSRQRYWGEPIPIIHCAKCGQVPVPEKDLPVLLPELDHFKPTGTGESPLALALEWVNVFCPRCQGPAKRETNTMPQWAGSCWYYLRFIDPQNPNLAWSPDIEKAWAPVDVYVGGSEHAVLHLLYARFWHKVLFDQGAVSTPEPFQKLRHQGLILSFSNRDSKGVYHPYEEVSYDSNGNAILTQTGEKLEVQIEKMSKSKKNVVSPDAIISRFGADVFRIYEMFMGPFEQSKPWDMRSIEGSARFLRKVWVLAEDAFRLEPGDGLTSLRHRTIKKVTEDIENFSFNTAISALMIYSNEIHAHPYPARADIETLLSLLNPFAPHLTEELWEKLGARDFLARTPWPIWEPRYLEENQIEYAVQVNGKTRGTFSSDRNISQEDLKQAALALEKVRHFTDGKTIVKTVIVPHRLVNIVVKENLP